MGSARARRQLPRLLAPRSQLVGSRAGRQRHGRLRIHAADHHGHSGGPAHAGPGCNRVLGQVCAQRARAQGPARRTCVPDVSHALPGIHLLHHLPVPGSHDRVRDRHRLHARRVDQQPVQLLLQGRRVAVHHHDGDQLNPQFRDSAAVAVDAGRAVRHKRPPDPLHERAARAAPRGHPRRYRRCCPNQVDRRRVVPREVGHRARIRFHHRCNRLWLHHRGGHFPCPRLRVGHRLPAVLRRGRCGLRPRHRVRTAPVPGAHRCARNGHPKLHPDHRHPDFLLCGQRRARFRAPLPAPVQPRSHHLRRRYVRTVLLRSPVRLRGR
mmetsp:Transcript_23279/g.88200  ORF Transcript_23279/g.88200 Transcript_23279/m.88200 type:complete len:323 (+) Transcript_23279:1475-2443(+)